MKKIFLAGAFSSLFAFSALAQTAASASAGIGPAPVNSKPDTIIKKALSPETRQTLKEAMNSVPETPTK